MITPISLALLIGAGIESHGHKIPFLAKALGSDGPFPYPAYLQKMMKVYDETWMGERAGLLVDESLLVKFKEVHQKLEQFDNIKDLIANGELTIVQKRKYVERALILTKEVEAIVAMMEGANA